MDETGARTALEFACRFVGGVFDYTRRWSRVNATKLVRLLYFSGRYEAKSVF